MYPSPCLLCLLSWFAPTKLLLFPSRLQLLAVLLICPLSQSVSHPCSSSLRPFKYWRRFNRDRTSIKQKIKAFFSIFLSDLLWCYPFRTLIFTPVSFKIFYKWMVLSFGAFPDLPALLRIWDLNVELMYFESQQSSSTVCCFQQRFKN